MSLTNTQYAALMRQYDAKQQRAHRIAAERKTALYEKEPRLAAIEQEISTCSVTQARKLIEGDDSALTILRQKLDALRKERQSLYDSMQLPENYLQPPYECVDCKDTGYIGNEKCHCLKQAAIDLVYTQSNIRQILEQENFSHFSFNYYSDTETDPITGLTSLACAHAAYDEAKRFIHAFDHSFENLFFYGDTGVGKTYLSNCIAKELLDTGHSVIYFTAFQLFDIFEKNVFEKDADAVHAHHNIFDCDLLIIDDLGTEVANSFTTSQLFLCLNERILRKKSTIISTNLSLGKLADIYSERTFSRISSNYQLLKLAGADIRIQKKLMKN